MNNSQNARRMTHTEYQRICCSRNSQDRTVHLVGSTHCDVFSSVSFVRIKLCGDSLLGERIFACTYLMTAYQSNNSINIHGALVYSKSEMWVLASGLLTR